MDLDIMSLLSDLDVASLFIKLYDLVRDKLHCDA
jgi:hypothetical protein